MILRESLAGGYLLVQFQRLQCGCMTSWPTGSWRGVDRFESNWLEIQTKWSLPTTFAANTTAFGRENGTLIGALWDCIFIGNINCCRLWDFRRGLPLLVTHTRNLRNCWLKQIWNLIPYRNQMTHKPFSMRQDHWWQKLIPNLFQ